MSEPDDLLGKADAFLKRYHPSSAAGRHDVPVLTEVIDESRETPPKADPPAAAQNTAIRPELAEMEQRLKQSILDAIASHVKTVEEPLRAHLDAHLQNALVALSVQIKTDLETLIRETVARSVAAEMTRLRGPSRGS